jgi:hypothetical protein
MYHGCDKVPRARIPGEEAQMQRPTGRNGVWGTLLLSLVFFIVSVVVSVVVSATHGLPREVIRHRSPERVSAHIAGPEVNAAKDAPVAELDGWVYAQGKQVPP